MEQVQDKPARKRTKLDAPNTTGSHEESFDLFWRNLTKPGWETETAEERRNRRRIVQSFNLSHIENQQTADELLGKLFKTEDMVFHMFSLKVQESQQAIHNEATAVFRETRENTLTELTRQDLRPVSLIERLPQDVLVLILSQLTRIPDLFAARKVCPTLANAASLARLRSLDLVALEIDEHPDCVNYLDAANMKTLSINFDGYHGKSLPTPLRDFFLGKQVTPNLTRLELLGNFPKNLYLLPSIKHVTLRGCTPSIQKDIFHYCPALLGVKKIVLDEGNASSMFHLRLSSFELVYHSGDENLQNVPLLGFSLTFSGEPSLFPIDASKGVDIPCVIPHEINIVEEGTGAVLHQESFAFGQTANPGGMMIRMNPVCFAEVLQKGLPHFARKGKRLFESVNYDAHLRRVLTREGTLTDRYVKILRYEREILADRVRLTTFIHPTKTLERREVDDAQAREALLEAVRLIEGTMP